MIVNRTKASDIFGVALTTIDAWLRAGCPGEQVNGKWEIESALMFKWNLLNGEEGLDLTQEKAKESVLRQERLGQEIDEKKDLLVDAEWARERWIIKYSAAKAKLLALPTKMGTAVLGVDNLAQAQSIIKKHIHEALNELADRK